MGIELVQLELVGHGFQTELQEVIPTIGPAVPEDDGHIAVGPRGDAVGVDKPEGLLELLSEVEGGCGGEAQDGTEDEGVSQSVVEEPPHRFDVAPELPELTVRLVDNGDRHQLNG